MGFDLAFFMSNIPALLQGAVLTGELSVLSIIIGFCLGVLIGLVRLSRFLLFRYVAIGYINFIRGTPMLVQLFVIYYGLPQFGLNLSPFTAALAGMSLNDAGYVAEITRGAIQSIDKRQWEAAEGTGLNYYQTMLHIIFPQALKRMIAPLGNEFIQLIKASSLVSTIAMVELTRTAQLISSATFRPMELLVGAALIYLAITLILSSVLSRVERRL